MGVQSESVTQPASDCSERRTAYEADAAGFWSIPWESAMPTVPSRPLDDVTTTEKMALPLAWVQVHWLAVGLAPPADLAVTVIDAGHAAEPVLANGLSAVQPGSVTTTLVFRQPETLV